MLELGILVDTNQKLQIPPALSQYTYTLSLLLFVINNSDMYKHNCEIHTTDARIRTNLHLPQLRLKRFKKCVYYSGIKVYNYLSSNIKSLIYDERKFKTTGKSFLLTNSVYCLEEYFNINIS